MSTAKTPARLQKKDRAKPLRKYVKRAIRLYLEDMGKSQPDKLYRTVMSQVEPPLIEEVLKHTGGNQSKAARILGMTRNTLRSKIKHYDITPGNK